MQREVSLDQVTKLIGVKRMDRLLGGFYGARQVDIACPSCGWTQADVDRTSLAGCGMCYSVLVFRDEA